MEITVKNEIVFFDRDNGQPSVKAWFHYTHEANIEPEAEIVFWHTDNPANILHYMTVPVYSTGGNVFIDMLPGQMIVVELRETNRNPAVSYPVRKIKIACILRDGETDFNIVDQDHRVHGTYIESTLFVPVAARMIFCKYSMEMWQIAPNTNMPYFDRSNFSGTIENLNYILDQNHRFEIAPLFPGNKYFLLMLFSDIKGNWQCLKLDRTTLEREVTIKIKDIRIIKDSDGGSPADETKFYHNFSEDSNPFFRENILVIQFADDYNDNQVLNPASLIIDYRSDTNRTTFLSNIKFSKRKFLANSIVFTSEAFEDDGPYYDDHASTTDQFSPEPQPPRLNFKIGNEETDMCSETIQAYSDVDSNDYPFIYDVEMEYSCNYL